MLKLLATDEFADWFRTLPDSDAEDVATALEVLGRLDGEDSAGLSSDLLLWYQYLPGEIQPTQGSGAFNWSDDYLRVVARIGRVLGHLQSSTVRTKLTQLPMEQASVVRSAIGRIKTQTRWHRLVAIARDESEASTVLVGVQRDYCAALEALGLQEPSEPVQCNSLRQLDLTERAPGMRILYGVNSPKHTALIVLGEHLDRRAYGPSVRRALSIWQRFAAGSEGGEGLGPVPGSRHPT